MLIEGKSRPRISKKLFSLTVLGDNTYTERVGTHEVAGRSPRTLPIVKDILPENALLYYRPQTKSSFVRDVPKRTHPPSHAGSPISYFNLTGINRPTTCVSLSTKKRTLKEGVFLTPVFGIEGHGQTVILLLLLVLL